MRITLRLSVFVLPLITSLLRHVVLPALRLVLRRGRLLAALYGRILSRLRLVSLHSGCCLLLGRLTALYGRILRLCGLIALYRLFLLLWAHA